MGIRDEIDQAIVAHGLWKQRLLSAVTQSANVFQLAQVQVNNGCDFGKWFYGLPSRPRLSLANSAPMNLAVFPFV
jgi:hypothetical protein